MMFSSSMRCDYESVFRQIYFSVLTDQQVSYTIPGPVGRFVSPLLARMPYYAVKNGRQKGVFQNWNDCKIQVDGFPGAIYKKFSTLDSAKDFAATGRYPSGTKILKVLKPGNLKGLAGSFGGLKKHHASYSTTLKSSGATNNVKPIYVDGALRGNGKSLQPKSGYGVYYGENDSRNAAVPLKGNTNQQAELKALLHALKDIKKDTSGDIFLIRTDSMYTINAITKWLDNWAKNGFKTANNQPVKNREVIEEAKKLYDEVRAMYAAKGHEFVIEHVRGHVGEPGNEAADKLANLGADKL